MSLEEYWGLGKPSIEELKALLIKQPIYISCFDEWYQQFIYIPKNLDPDEVLKALGMPEVYLDSNDFGDFFLERAWEWLREIPEELRPLIVREEPNTHS